MDISVRSYLTAGTAAVVGAAAIGLSPVLPSADLSAAALPAPVVAEIALTGTSIPWETIISVVKTLSSSGSLGAGVTSLIQSVGTEFAKEALPVVTAAAGDVVKYVGAALADLLTGPGLPPIDFAAILATATAAITAGDLSGAIKAVTSGLSAPLTQISQVLFTPEFRAFVTDKAGSVLGALPEILRAAVQKIVGIDIKPIIDALSGLLPGLLPAASTTRVLSAAATSATVVGTLTAVRPGAAADVRALSVAPEAEAAPTAPAEDSAAAAPAAGADAASESKAAPEVAPAEAAPAVEVVDATPAEEAPAVPVETVSPVADSPAVAPEAAGSADAAPVVTRAAKPGPRGKSSAAKSSARAAAASDRG